MAGQTVLERTPTGEAIPVEHTRSGLRYRPNVDILESHDELIVLADLPGVQAEDIDINFERGTLTLLAKTKPRQAPETEFLSQEYGLGDFYRSFEVSEHINVDGIRAEFSDGVLTLHLPKVETAKPRRIEVKIK